MNLKRAPGTWSIVEALGETKESFWDPIDRAGSYFWEALEDTPWCDSIVNLVSEFYGDNWFICSAPSYCDTSYTGKVRWLKQKFGRSFDRFLLSPHKSLFAKPGVVLLDDRQENINQFKFHGGLGILYPSYGNDLWPKRYDPIPYVTASLEILRGLS